MKTEKFKTLFKYALKSNLKASDGADEGNFPFYTSSSIISKKTDKAQYYDESLIFGNGGTANVHYCNEPFATTSHCFVAVPRTKAINPKYVYYYLFGNIHLLERGFKGAGLKNISPKFIENLDIPILPIETQNKIVAVLDKASSIVSKRNEAILLYERFLTSIFYEFFGDPVINSKQWLKKPLSDFGEIITGNTPPRKISEYYNEEFIEWIKTDNIQNDKIHPTQASEYLSKSGAEKGRVVDSNALLVACIAGSLSSIGRVSLTNRKVAFNQQINAIQPNTEVSPIFLYYLIKYSSLYIQSHATKGMKKIITKGEFQKIMFICPPYDLQLKFENIANQIALTNNKLAESQIEISLLFNSLVQKVYNGELNFNIDIELDALINEIDLQKKENDLSKISTDFAYLQRLIDKLNSQEFNERELYDKAKHAVFQLLKNDVRIVQEYDENSKSIKLAMK
ncbi:hypothetical protein SDC9_54372 [bioreactor metagenome]|jgi:type I restriction enzyme S subunit|uniref:Type I restriction modification DNA specificity domain-containing protein n=1 Tax=bioreactor metagenome TaxID=1076179 RepID=A0A644WVY8_9ZZZZ